MRAFTYERANSPAEATEMFAGTPNARFIAGGSNLLDLMKLQIETPGHLIDINHIGLNKIESTEDGGVRIGALMRNTEVAAHMRIRKDYPLVSYAILAGASGQLRNVATIAGNLLQRTRCPYFYDIYQPCNKRKPGSGCAAIGGNSRNASIIGFSESCIATNPSDLAIALRTLDARVEILLPDGTTRIIAIGDFHRLPDNTPDIDTALKPGELITAVILPKPIGGSHIYRKVRDRRSYSFALVSVGAVVHKGGNGRVTLGGVAPKPWRDEAAELELSRGAKAVTCAILANAKPTSETAFKLPLVERIVGGILAGTMG